MSSTTTDSSTETESRSFTFGDLRTVRDRTGIEIVGIDAEGYKIAEYHLDGATILTSRLSHCCEAAPTGDELRGGRRLVCKACRQPVSRRVGFEPAEPIVPIAEHELAEQLARFWETRGDEAVTS
jgi:hypothetical protein